MPLPVDFLQTSDGDVDFSLGLRRTPDLVTFVKQQVSQTLAFFQGEWFLDQTLGIPFFRDVLGKRPDLNLLRALYRRALLRTRGVGSVDTLAVGFDGRTRAASVEGQIRTIDGTEVPLAPTFRIDL